jgi:hypothetical protein
MCCGGEGFEGGKIVEVARGRSERRAEMCILACGKGTIEENEEAPQVEREYETPIKEAVGKSRGFETKRLLICGQARHSGQLITTSLQYLIFT